MKRLRVVLLLLVATCSFGATTYTTRAGIPKPADGDTGWGTTIRAAYDVIDSSMCLQASSNTFTSEQYFMAGINMNDQVGIKFYGLAGTSAAQILNPNLSDPTKAQLEIMAPDGLAINQTTPISGVDVAIFHGTSGSTGKFAVVGSSADASTTYSGFTSTNNVDASTLWSIMKKDGSANQPIVTDGSSHLSFSTSLSSISVGGYMQFMSKTLAQLALIIPSSVGQVYYCSNCTTDLICGSTQTVTASWGRVSARTTACQ
jgi:hypothetical protein